MRASEYLLATLKETPADAELESHRLMLRAGMIRKLATGLYTWLPLGYRVLKKVSQIVREEMDKIGALEMLMPAVQPAELWQETERWQQYGSELLKLVDRHEREFCFGPTHEEVITDLVRKDIRSYKELPRIFYQIQTKFRDEIRPRFGIMRAREFLMKDAYSFHLDGESLEQTYAKIYTAYQQIFSRIGFDFRPVLADTGSIGGNLSHEFQVLAESGEDLIAYSDASDYAANLERAESLAPQQSRPAPSAPISLVETPQQKTIKAVCQHLNVPAQAIVKTLLVKGNEGNMVALVLRGDHELNPIKVAKLTAVAEPMELVAEAAIEEVVGCQSGYIGPVDLSVPVIVDREAAVLANFICGANINDKHYNNVNWGRDLAEPEVADLRNVQEGDSSPDGKGSLKFARGIEVGHIFQLGDKYSKAMNATVLDADGRDRAVYMGCYGIGISRIVAASIEQNHDENGIIWPEAIAPFDIALVPINYNKSTRVREACDQLYSQLQALNYEVWLDDRKERPGVMFANVDLIGIPHRVVVSERGLDNSSVEYKHRRQADSENIRLDGVIDFLKTR